MSPAFLHVLSNENRGGGQNWYKINRIVRINCLFGFECFKKNEARDIVVQKRFLIYGCVHVCQIQYTTEAGRGGGRILESKQA
jgi:hypothetical protein